MKKQSDRKNTSRAEIALNNFFSFSLSGFTVSSDSFDYLYSDLKKAGVDDPETKLRKFTSDVKNNFLSNPAAIHKLTVQMDDLIRDPKLNKIIRKRNAKPDEFYEAFLNREWPSVEHITPAQKEYLLIIDELRHHIFELAAKEEFFTSSAYDAPKPNLFGKGASKWASMEQQMKIASEADTITKRKEQLQKEKNYQPGDEYKHYDKRER